MTRSRSGSFYCVVEPSWAPLSIAQKAAISTAPSTRTPPPSTPSSQGTLARQKRMEGRSVEPSPSVEMIASPGSRHHHHQRSPASSSLSSITNSLRNVVPFQHKERRTMMVAAAATAAAGVVAGRHKYSPARPSPLRRQVNAPEPLCPSALWISQRELLPLYYPSNSSPQSTSSSRSSSRGGLRRTVLKNTFLAGPMAEKAKMYGLRVAWCVFGDAKEEMARDIFGPVPQEPPAPVQVALVEQVEVSDEGLDHVFVEHDETLDSDESSSDSEYSEEEDDTASEESDDLELDDEDQIEREVYAIFREASFVLDKLPEVTPVPTAVAVDELWEVVQV